MTKSKKRRMAAAKAAAAAASHADGTTNRVATEGLGSSGTDSTTPLLLRPPPALAAQLAQLRKQLEAGVFSRAYTTVGSMLSLPPASSERLSVLLHLASSTTAIELYLRQSDWRVVLSLVPEAERLWQKAHDLAVKEGQGSSAPGPPFPPERYEWICTAHEGLQDWEAMLKCARDSLVWKTTTFSLVHYFIAKGLFQQAKLEEAIRAGEKAKSDDPAAKRKTEALLDHIRRISSLKSAGNEAYKAGDFATAIRRYTEALSAHCEVPLVIAMLHSNRALAHFYARQFPAALSDSALALKHAPHFAKAFATRARAHCALAQYSAAQVCIDQAISFAPAGSSERDGYVAEKKRIERLKREREDEAKKGKPKPAGWKDHYAILGLSRLASANDIRAAFRRLSLQHHPDKGGKHELFVEIKESYEVLIDPVTKRRYDLS